MPAPRLVDASALFAPLLQRRSVGLAVSGGADSLALMLLAAEWRRGQATGPTLLVYSVDHGLRPEAAAEAAFVIGEAEKLGLTGRTLRWEGNKPRAGLLAAARAARYRLLAEAMAADGAELLLTGHHLGDQAETVLMRLAHGSGIDGLRGMDRLAVVEGCAIYRPLLAVEPERLVETVRAAGLVPIEDPSNRDRVYERVRWRQLMPQLAALGLDRRRLAAFAERMADAEVVLEAETNLRREELVTETGEGAARMPHEQFALLPRAIAVRLLGQVLRAVGGDRKPHALAAVERLHQQLAESRRLPVRTLHGCLVSSDGATISIAREPGRDAGTAEPKSVSLRINSQAMRPLDFGAKPPHQ